MNEKKVWTRHDSLADTEIQMRMNSSGLNGATRILREKRNRPKRAVCDARKRNNLPFSDRNRGLQLNQCFLKSFLNFSAVRYISIFNH